MLREERCERLIVSHGGETDLAAVAVLDITHHRELTSAHWNPTRICSCFVLSRCYLLGMPASPHEATEDVTIKLRYGLWLEVLRFCRYCRFDPFDYLAWLVEHQ